MQRIANRPFGLIFIVAVMTVGLSGCGSATTTSDWSFTDAGGDIRSLSDSRGGVVVLAFINTWCEPCQEAALHLQQLQMRFADRGVRIVFVSSWERGDPASYMEDRGFTYGLLLNGTTIARDYKVKRVPTFCVIGANGREVARFDGFNKKTMARLARAIKKHSRANPAEMHVEPVVHHSDDAPGQ